ncbi:MAG: hypothetical protein M3077_05725 [Candidatus Dormibacteraeota bacterium]|nr:hypothetical protein [Candidatus Dormibacteraeota bacterium]
MGVGVQALRLQDQVLLLDFSLNCIDALALDDVWTSGASTGDAGAVEVGGELDKRLDVVGGLMPEVSDLLLGIRYELNARWSESPERRALSADVSMTLDTWLEQQGGGLGDGAVAAMAWLREELPHERGQLQERITELEANAESSGDLRKITKAFMALAAGAALVAVSAAVASALVGPIAAGAALLAVKDLAVAAFSIAATGAVGTVVMPPGQQPPPPPARA